MSTILLLHLPFLNLFPVFLTNSPLSFTLLPPRLTNLLLPDTSTYISTIPLTTSPPSFSLFYILAQPNSTRWLPNSQQKLHSRPGVNLFWFFSGTVSHYYSLHSMDHFPIFTKLSVVLTPLPPPTCHSFSRLHSIDIDLFLSNVQSSSLIISPPASLDSLLSSYNATLSTLLDKYAPVINKFCKRSTKFNPWFSSTLRAFRSTVRPAENLYKRTHSALSFSSFKSLCNRYHKLILYPKRSITLTSSLRLIILAVSGKLSICYSIGNRHLPYLSLLHFRLSQPVLLLSLQPRFINSAIP